jgi:O-antigen ligase
MSALADPHRPAAPAAPHARRSLPRRLYVLLLVFVALSYAATTVLFLAVGAPVSTLNQATKAGLVALGLLLLLAFAARPVAIHRRLLPLLMFFAVYGFRLLYDIVVDGILMPFQTPLYALGYFFGLTLLPILVLAIAYRPSDDRAFFRLTLGFLVLCNVALFLHSALLSELSAEGLFSRRIEVVGEVEGTAVLNPLIFGTVGAMLAAMLVGVFATAQRVRARWLVIGAVLFVIAIANVLFSASRGPALAFFAALMLLLLALCRQPLRRASAVLQARTWWLLLALLGASAVVVLTQSEALLLAERLFSLFAERRGSGGEERDLIYNAVWLDFLSSPVFGRSWVVSFESQSPHNVVLEALMATGLVGFVLLAWALGLAVAGIWQLVDGAAGPFGVGLGLATTCLLVLGFTSSSIGQTPELWIYLALVTVMPTRRAQPQPASPAAPA